MEPFRVIFADDDEETKELVRLIFLNQKDICLMTVSNGRETLDLWSRTPVDLIILDIMMPVMDGMETLHHIRQVSLVPVILVTAKDQEDNVIQGFERGAYDYITKPFPPRIFETRVRAILNRIRPNTRKNGHKLEYEGLLMDLRSRRVVYYDNDVNMTSLEFQLLQYLMTHTGLVLSKEDLLRNVWGYHSTQDLNMVEALVTRLRKKLSTISDSLDLIQTVRGVGYRFGVNEESEYTWS
jgi:two-component system, OmpR family, response regulator ResD